MSFSSMQVERSDDWRIKGRSLLVKPRSLGWDRELFPLFDCISSALSLCCYFLPSDSCTDPNISCQLELRPGLTFFLSFHYHYDRF